MRIAVASYWMGRDARFAAELTTSIRVNATITVEAANDLIALYEAATGDEREWGINSGWRPAAINAAIRGAALRSKHMTAEAIDIGDEDDALDTWLLTEAGQKALEQCGLWLEHPDATPRWCHVQTRAPRSGNRVFRP